MCVKGVTTFERSDHRSPPPIGKFRPNFRKKLHGTLLGFYTPPPRIFCFENENSPNGGPFGMKKAIFSKFLKNVRQVATNRIKYPHFATNVHCGLWNDFKGTWKVVKSMIAKKKVLRKMTWKNEKKLEGGPLCVFFLRPPWIFLDFRPPPWVIMLVDLRIWSHI